MIKKTLLAAVVLTVAQLVPAQATLTTTQGDLLLSFFTSNGSTVGANSYTINLGAARSFIGSTGTIANPTEIVNISADLVTAFGANWWNNVDLKMQLIGGYNSIATPSAPDAARTVYASSALSSVNNAGNSTPIKSSSSTNHNTWANGVSGFSDSQNNRAAGGAVASNAAIMVTADVANDVTNYNAPLTVGLYYGIGANPNTSFTAGNVGGGFEAAVDLWKIDKATYSAPTYVTSFAIDSTGKVSAVPEPSTVAMLGLAGLAGAAALRRRNKK